MSKPIVIALGSGTPGSVLSDAAPGGRRGFPREKLRRMAAPGSVFALSAARGLGLAARFHI